VDEAASDGLNIGEEMADAVGNSAFDPFACLGEPLCVVTPPFDAGV
jgi:hypothetical protein